MQANRQQEASGDTRKPYAKPTVESHRVFEASLACTKVPHSPACSFNIQRTKS